MTAVFIYTDLMPFLIYRDKMRVEAQNHYPYAIEMALNHYKLKPKVSVCFRLQSGLQNWHFIVNRFKALTYIYVISCYSCVP